MVETLKFTTDIAWRKFLGEELGWSFEQSETFPSYLTFQTEFTARSITWDLTYHLVLRGSYVDLYEADREGQRFGEVWPEPRSVTPVRTYPDLRHCFWEMCRDPPGPGDLAQSLMVKLYQNRLDQYTYWCLRRRVDVSKVTLSEIFPEVLENLVIDYLTPPYQRILTEEAHIGYRVEEEKLLIECTWGGETVIKIELMVG